jgi:hypothetical protein
MVIRKLVKPPASDIESYAAPMNYELAGKAVDIRFDGGERVSLAFAEYPARELRKDGDPQTLHYRCVKAAAGVFYIACTTEETHAAYILDTDEGLAARIVTDRALKSSFSFGSIGAESAAARLAFTDDLDGNAVVWNLGSDDTSSFEALYGGGGVSVSLPRLRGGNGVYSVSDFKAVKTGDGMYLQNAVVTTPSGAVCVNMLSDFRRVTCAGSIFGVSEAGGVKHKLFGGYGRVLSV